MFEKINYYGFDRATFSDCEHLICPTNYKHLMFINLWFLILNLIYLNFSTLKLFGVQQSNGAIYSVYAAVSFLLAVLLFGAKKFSLKHSRLLIYLVILLLASYGILISLSQPYSAATTFHVLFVLAALSYMDTMLPMGIVFVLSTLAFSLSAWFGKSLNIAYQDIFNAVVNLTLAISLHYAFQHARMGQFVTYRKNMQIQQELEVKSSFDALTSLLNRGKFFSMAA
ncbi:MAG: hypothetical protein IJU50_06735 [Lachnospiraceae bacterium]|nr:hypothetical protein [Lachnospiraceae bacterium]